MKVALLPDMQMDVCLEIKKHFLAWRFLEVLDCSKRSFLHFLAFCSQTFSKKICFRNVLKHFIVFKAIFLGEQRCCLKLSNCTVPNTILILI